MSRDKPKQYGKMIGEPVQEEHYGDIVWVSPAVEALRRSDCLCYNCAKLKPADGGDECSIASAFYEICKTENVALAVTRCPVFEFTETPPTF